MAILINRPPWLQEIILAMGAPIVDVGEWQEMPWGCKRRCWVWISGFRPGNHNIIIDWFEGRHRDRYEIKIHSGAHRGLELTMFEPPKDDLMRTLIQVAQLVAGESCTA